ncbi:YbdD/YjiX family protein [Bacillus sp. FJAT-49736]|uniref:YbdD/YjiX family protein n=1 Tax=Bacillus sp. FJAT-49736 TaxID=2833582 RepID=UPI001BC9FE74|nr:YbdD/YjiX family protein [Bacillus sp. FJAT-49736]MBS4171846.1 YbdD/YjiX family protein [Bacillus sp. FJAT-49736]
MNTITATIKKIQCNIKIIFGLPNYDQYVAHRKRKHPNEPIMSEKEYYMYALKEKYESGKVNRCC